MTGDEDLYLLAKNRNGDCSNAENSCHCNCYLCSVFSHRIHLEVKRGKQIMLQWLFQRKQNFKSKYKYEFWHKEMKKKTWWCFANKFQSRRGFKWKYRNANTDTTEWKKTWWDAGYTNQDKIIRLSNLSGKNFWLELKICIFWLKIKKNRLSKRWKFLSMLLISFFSFHKLEKPNKEVNFDIQKTWWDAGYFNQDKITRLSNLSGKLFSPGNVFLELTN